MKKIPQIALTIGIILSFALMYYLVKKDTKITNKPIITTFKEQAQKSKIINPMCGGGKKENNIDASDTSKIILENIKPGDKLISPSNIAGKLAGSWCFENTCHLKIFSNDGTLLVQKNFQLNGEWMTEDLVPFTTNVTFTTPKEKNGMLVFESDNPSGNPENCKQVQIPVTF